MNSELTVVPAATQSSQPSTCKAGDELQIVRVCVREREREEEEEREKGHEKMMGRQSA